MRLLITVVADGVVVASWLFLVSAGLTFIFGVLRILNVAHGSLYALGAYAGAFLVVQYLGAGGNPYLTYLILLLAALLVGVVVGPLIETVFLRRVYGREEEVQLLLTFALFLILEDVAKLIFGVDPYFADKPYALLGQVNLGGISYAWYPFLLTGVAIAAGVALWALVNRTRFGKIVVAVINDREVSGALGIDVPRVYTFAFVVGAVLAAVGGAFTAPMVAVVPGIGVEVIVLAFAVVAVGGMGSVAGAALGAVMVGLARAAAIHIVPEAEMFAIYLVMALVLVVRPQGLFGEPQVRKI